MYADASGRCRAYSFVSLFVRACNHAHYFLPYMFDHMHVIGEDEERERKKKVKKEKL